MAAIHVLLAAIVLLPFISQGQPVELVEFYKGYQVSEVDKFKCDSIFKLIEERRDLFSHAYRKYGESHRNHTAFIYDWDPCGSAIEVSLNQRLSWSVRDLVYYSYFDLAYGSFGYVLKSSIVKQAIHDIEPRSVVWALEPSLLVPIVQVAGGEEANRQFIEKLYTMNQSETLRKYIRGNLSPDRILKAGKQLPNLVFKNIADSSHLQSLAQFQGKYLLVDIWATWCKPCIEELPNLVETYAKRDPSLEFLSISIDQSTSSVAEFIDNHKELTWRMGVANRKELLNQLQVNGIPLTILVNPAGVVLAYGNELRNLRLAQTLKTLGLLRQHR